jgi:hypothetical protein
LKARYFATIGIYVSLGIMLPPLLSSIYNVRQNNKLTPKKYFFKNSVESLILGEVLFSGCFWLLKGLSQRKACWQHSLLMMSKIVDDTKVVTCQNVMYAMARLSLAVLR